MQDLYENNQSSDSLRLLEEEHLWMKVITRNHTAKIFNFYQNMLEATGSLAFLIKIMKYIVLKLPDSPQDLVRVNKFMYDQLTLVICMAAYNNQNVKALLEKEIPYLIKYSIMFDSSGQKLIKDKPRHYFKPSTFDADTHFKAHTTPNDQLNPWIP